MSEIVEFNKLARVRNEASIWLVRILHERDSRLENELCAWLGLDPMHRRELLALADVWDELEVLKELAPLFNDVTARQQRQSRTKASLGKYRWPAICAVAGFLFASFVLSVGVWQMEIHTDRAVVLSDNKNSIQSADQGSKLSKGVQNGSMHYKTLIGNQKQLQLSDGSRATLNTDTHIEVNFTPSQRTVFLHKGEAHFNVFKDKGRALIVLVSGRSVEAVGTAFSVRKKSNIEIEVAVEEGQVAVYSSAQLGSVSGSERAELPGLSARSLDAGEVLTIKGNQETLNRYDIDDLSDRLAWKQGMIVINDEALDFVIEEFTRHNRSKLLLADRSLGEIRVAGYFRLGDIDGLLVALEQNFNIHSEQYPQSNTFVLSQR